MNSKGALYPGENQKNRMSADERLALEMAREMKWYEITGRTDHLPGEIRHTRFENGVPVETKILPPLEEDHDEPIPESEV